ncbi:ACT domain protein [uncultured archaeon]|nr:ACT domain protein [uncultured archaeon]
MEQLTLVMEDKVGALADISYLLGKSRINIDSLTAVSMDNKAILTFFVKDARKASQLLKSNGYKVLESEVLVVRLKDEPGRMAALSGLLAKNNINVTSLYFVAKDKGIAIVALHVDKTTKAKRVLAPMMNLEG